MSNNDVVIIEVNPLGVVQVRADIKDAQFLSRIEPAISKLDAAIQKARKTEVAEGSAKY